MHTVQPGDTVWSIARTYGKDPLQILSWNRLTRKSRIYPGQELIINQ
jgi:LysM repeat protein